MSAALWSPSRSNVPNPRRRVALALVVAASIAVGAQLAVPVPLSPVPVSLQTLFVTLAALLLPWRSVNDGVLLYLALGAFGAPVFAGGKGGVDVLLGPTGGFLVGFLVAAPLASWVSQRFSESGPRAVADLVAAIWLHSIVLAFGVWWLAAATGRSIADAIAVGALPFVPGGVLKSAVAVGCAAVLRRWLGR